MFWSFSECFNETYDGATGILEFPDNETKYQNELNCFLEITVPEGNHINFTFSQFDFEESNDCDNDFLQVFNKGHKNFSILDKRICDGEKCKYCHKGPGVDKSFVSEGNQISLWIHSDEAETGEGFTLNWQSVKECDCDKDGSEKSCESETEKCKCKPHFTGDRCEKCEDNYWKNATSKSKLEFQIDS